MADIPDMWRFSTDKRARLSMNEHADITAYSGSGTSPTRTKSMRTNQLQDILENLEQAIEAHERWHEALLRSLVCNLPHAAVDLRQDAHLHCRFGRWYAAEAPQELRAASGFTELAAAHEALHARATDLLQRRQQVQCIAVEDYDPYVQARHALLQRLRELKQGIEYRLYRHDQLTGAKNRLELMPQLRLLHEQAVQRRSGGVLVLMDLDHFKRVNDRFGHQVGDRVLSETINCLTDQLRPHDKVFRYGGEEFLIALVDIGSSDAFAVVERIRKRLAACEFRTREAAPFHVTASFGIAPVVADVDVADSIDRADVALYAAKAAGRNCTKLWSEKMAKRLSDAPSSAG